MDPWIICCAQGTCCDQGSHEQAVALAKIAAHEMGFELKEEPSEKDTLYQAIRGLQKHVSFGPPA